jgi:hypothetical protein
VGEGSVVWSALRVARWCCARGRPGCGCRRLSCSPVFYLFVGVLLICYYAKFMSILTVHLHANSFGKLFLP